MPPGFGGVDEEEEREIHDMNTIIKKRPAGPLICFNNH